MEWNGMERSKERLKIDSTLSSFLLLLFPHSSIIIWMGASSSMSNSSSVCIRESWNDMHHAKYMEYILYYCFIFIHCHCQLLYVVDDDDNLVVVVVVVLQQTSTFGEGKCDSIL